MMDPKEKESGPPAANLQDEGLEFELTDLVEARRVLDNESVSQFDVATFVPPAHWKRVRRDKLPTDRALSGHAIDWLLSLSPDLRPEKLGEQFPRVANALAAVWRDPVERRAALDKLVDGDRKMRAGFPREVREELAALRNWAIALRGWDEPF
jgi:hypothetical protein